MIPRVKHVREPKEAGDMYIGRPSKWGNPFTIGKHGSRAEVIEKHRQWLLDQPQLLDSIHELGSRNLICYCAPSACHGDTLLMLANPGDPS
ncbi:hypothetical protein LCGC14_0820210 [marine sediment metagenome]|uniref:DUF4326 domain-containing protein n=1 Tax=marine sediment metagenome TaxID=412755 RepID=A0A0F9S476_9ZZZZ